MFQNIQDVQANTGYVENDKKEKKINIFSNIFAKNNILLYIIVFMVSTIGMGQEFSPFSLAIVAACIASGIPILGIAVLGLIGNIVVFGTTGALNYMVTLLVLIATLFIIKPMYNEEGRNEKIKIALNLFISVIAVELVKLMLTDFIIYDALVGLTMAIISVVFYKIFVNSLVVLQEFRTQRAFSIEEVIGASLLLAIAVSAIGDFSILGFSIRNILSILIVLILGWKNGILVGTTAGVTIGVTLGVIAETEPIMIAAYAISGMIAGILNRFGKIGVIVGFVVGNGVLAYISNGGTTDLIVFKEILLASIGLLAMPKNISINIEEFMGMKNLLPVSSSGTLNKSKEKETVERLNNVSQAIQDMAETYKAGVKSYEDLQDQKEENKNIFISELLNQLDGKEDNILYDDMVRPNNAIVEELFYILLDKQYIDRKDLLETFARHNSFIVGFDDKEISSYLEKNIETIVNSVNNAYKISKSNFVMQKKLTENKKNISAQLGEVSKAISNIATDMEKSINKKDEYIKQEKEILALINQANIEIEDVVITKGKNDRLFADISLKDENKDNSQIEKIKKILCDILDKKLILNDEQEEGILSFLEEDKYILNMGIAKSTKKGNSISGDNTLKIRLKDGKYLIAISDGMGSGEEANKSSKLALNMLQKLLSSGFDKDSSIELINTTILNTTDENFATLDIAIVDLFKGNIEFIKNGACPTYIKNKKRVNIIKSLTLPAGIMENVSLAVYDKDIENNDIMVMCSDGILDSNVEYKNKELWIKYLLEDLETEDSQKIADIIINEAIDNSYGAIKDDMSILVCKFMQKNM